MFTFQHPARPSWAAAFLLMLVALGGSALAKAGPLALGGNLNEHLAWATPQVLEQTRTPWLRGFVPASAFIDGRRDYANDPGLRALRQAAENGHKVVLSLKWDATGEGRFGRMPRAGSAREAAAFAFVDRLLDSVGPRLSALVLINELTIDTLPEDLRPDADGRLPVLAFLRRLAAHLDAQHRLAADGQPLPLYAGGLTRLDLPGNQAALPTRLMLRWVNQDPALAGADYHLHEPGLEETRRAAAFMHRAVPNKPLMVSELSWVQRWKSHLSDPIDASDAGRRFVSRYGLPTGLRVVDYLDRCRRQPVANAQWRDFLLAQPWFEPHYLKQVIPVLSANGVTLATYALTQDPSPGAPAEAEPLTTHSVPWLLNPLLVPRLAVSPAPGRLAQNPGLFEDYLDYQGAAP